MPLIEIKHWTGNILHTIEADNIKAAIEALVKVGTNLGGANLGGADLRGADLGRANLRRADLGGADLLGACYGDGVPLTKTPIYICGLKWDVMILDTHLKIGCELHPFTEWETAGDKIAADYSEEKWWKQHKKTIFALIKAVR